MVLEHDMCDRTSKGHVLSKPSRCLLEFTSAEVTASVGQRWMEEWTSKAAKDHGGFSNMADLSAIRDDDS
jgi:hypothetical protein